jgi:outer membrane protein
MLKRILGIGATVLLLSVAGLCAEAVRAPVTLQECIAAARQHSESLRMQQSRQAQAGATVAEYKGALLPEAGFRYVKTWRDTNGGQFDGDLDDAKLSVTQPLFHGFADIAAYRRAEALVTGAQFRYESLQQELAAATAAAFYDILLQDTDMINLRENAQLLADRRRELLDRVRLGKSRNSEILMIESQIAALNAQEESDAGLRADAVERLAFLTGLDPATLMVQEQQEAGSQALEPVGTYLTAVDARPETKIARNDIAAQRYAVRATQGLRLPSLDLGAGWYPLRSGSLADSTWDLLLSLQVPLFQGGSRAAQVDRETLRLQEMEYQLAYAARQITTEIRGLYAQAAAALRQVAAYQDAYAKAEKSYQIQVKDYGYGLVTNLDVLQSLSSMIEVKRARDKAAVQLRKQKTLLDIAALRQAAE